MAKVIAPPLEATLTKFNVAAEVATPSEAEVAILASTEDDGPEVLTEEQLEQIAADIVAIEAAIEELNSRKEAIKERIRKSSLGQTAGTKTIHKDAGIKVGVVIPSILDPEAVWKLAPYDHSVLEDRVVDGKRGKKEIVQVTVYPYRKLYDIKPSTTAIKKNLPEVTVYEEDGTTIKELGYDVLYGKGTARISFK